MAFPCPPADECGNGNGRTPIVLAKCTPNIAFCCPPKDSAEKKLAALQGMKDVICRMENELKVKVEPQVACLTCTPCCMPPGCAPGCPPCGVPCCYPICPDDNGCPPPCCPPPACCPPCCGPCPPNNGGDDDCEPPDVMVCYRIGGGAGTGGKKKKRGGKSEVIRVKKSKSRELRGGILYTGCDCEKRNGLQDQCMRTDCQGSPACLTCPDPTCGPSEYAGGKHLGKKNGSKGTKGADGKAEEDDDDGDYVEEEYQCFPAYIKGMDNCCACPVPMCP